MKRILFCMIHLLGAAIILHAQPVLLGMAKRGGNAQTGTIISYTASSGSLSTLNNFESLESSGTCKLMKAADGKLYGTLYNGRYGYGSIYSFDPASTTYTSLFHFGGSNGSNPIGLIQGTNGLFYGTTMNGGTYNGPNGNGVLYSYNLQTNEYKKLVDFDGTKGAGPTGVIQVANKLYGTTIGGGSLNKGVLFSYDLTTNTFTKLKDFDGTNGERPMGSLCLAANGLLYGMTGSGGQWNRGVIYSFNIAPNVTNPFVKRVDFNGTNGTAPSAYASLMQASNGKLYGMTTEGGSYSTYGVGVVFSFNPATNECKSIKDFDVASGSSPQCDLIESSNGRLYGLTSNGGANNNGVLFSIDLQTNEYLKERDFAISTGAYPLGNLVLVDGKFYGMTSRNAIGDTYSPSFGNIFSFDPDPSLRTYTVLKTIGENANGSFASAGLLKASDGKYYGMTINGGSNGFGVIFTIDPGSKAYTKLYDFDGATGGNPYGSLIQVGNKLYGLTTVGGDSNKGVLFSFNHETNGYQNVKDFNGADGANPYGSLLLAGNKLYGMTRTGGNNDLGVIFSFDLAANLYTKHWNFDKSTGANPFGNLVLANNGKLYGMTYAGGSSNLGVIFSFDPTSNLYTKLKDFDGITGAQPYGSLVSAKNGKLYGMTLRGGKSSVRGGFGSAYSDYGLIFSFDPVTNAFTKLKDFDNTNGANPNGSLMQASNDKLYGMTAGGGAYNKGVLFSYDLSGRTPYTKLKDFDGTNGANPSYGSVFTEVGTSTSTVASETAKNFVGNAAANSAVDATKTDNTVAAYPNPFTSQTTIRFIAKETGATAIALFNAQGEKVREDRLGVIQKGNILQYGLNLSHLAAGTYLYQVINGSHQERGLLLKKE